MSERERPVPEPGPPGEAEERAGEAREPAPEAEAPVAGVAPAAGVPEAAPADLGESAASAGPPAIDAAALEAAATAPAHAPAAAHPPAPRRPGPAAWLDERPERAIEVPRPRLAAQSRRDFILFAAGTVAAAAGAWWLLPDRTRARLLPGPAHDRLDTLAARLGLSRDARERALDRALTFDDDVAEALYSKGRRVRTYDRSQVTPLRNNYDGQTPGPEYLPGWSLELSGLASGARERLPIGHLLRRFAHVEQVTRLVCVEGWSAIAWWGGLRFADLLAAFPPVSGARWAALRSEVNLDGAGRSDPYYVSIDLGTARHPQTLLATHYDGRPLTLEHGAPLRLLVPMKLGLKNIKAVTHIAYSAAEPPDYWNERGYSKYDGL
ncbi:MAG TPA: molybdopterin-dependent oxidoreductase [Candidatus Eisenbacteria bacterium]